MPKRPPKRWFNSCVANVKKSSPDVDDPGAVCGNTWYNRMSQSDRDKALANEDFDVDPFDVKLLEEINAPPVEDKMGKTKKVLQHVADWWRQAQKEGADRIAAQDEKGFWPFLIKNIRQDLKVSSEGLVLAGLPASLIVDSFGLDEQDAATLTYKRAILKKKDGSTQEVDLQEFLEKIKPYTKSFNNPLEALTMGDPDQVLKVTQHIYGDDVVSWTVPAEKSEGAVDWPGLAHLAIVELYNADKFGMEPKLYKREDDKFVVDEEAVKDLVDAFEKGDWPYITALFPGSNPDYLTAIIQEAKSALDDLGGEQVNKLFPNINPEYLANLKESELREFVIRLNEMCGYTEGRTRRGYRDGSGPFAGSHRRKVEKNPKGRRRAAGEKCPRR